MEEGFTPWKENSYEPPISMRRKIYWIDEDSSENAIYINLDESEEERAISSESEQASSNETSKSSDDHHENLSFNSNDPKEIDLLAFLATERSNLAEMKQAVMNDVDFALADKKQKESQQERESEPSEDMNPNLPANLNVKVVSKWTDDELKKYFNNEE